MFDMHLDTSQLDRQAVLLDKWAQEFAGFEEERALAAGERMLAAIQAEAPGGIGGRMTLSVSLGVARIFGPPEAVFVERGTRPHQILPRQAQALHFFVKSGAEVFAASVDHPGQKPNPFIRRAVDAATPGIREEFGERVASRVRVFSQ